MPRKQNSFGSAQSFEFKGGGRIDKGKGVGAFGVYPSNRRYGTAVHRTVTEKWNLESDWVQWRRGYEIWLKAFYSKLVVSVDIDSDLYVDPETRYRDAQLLSILYQGTDYPTNVLFKGYRFPTHNSDVNTHYVAVRTPLKFDPETRDPVSISLGTVLEVLKGPEQQKYREVWVRGIPDAVRGALLLQMLGERLTDGETEATMKNLLVRNQENNKDEPAIYFGQTAPKDIRESSTAPLEPTEVTIEIPVGNIDVNPNPQNVYRINQGLSTFKTKATSIDVFNKPEDLIGKVVYVPDFFKSREIVDMPVVQWIEDDQFMAAFVLDAGVASEVFVLDPGLNQLPPSMYDISSLPQILVGTGGGYQISGTYIFRKSDYQRFFSPTYLQADQVEERVATASYSVLPFEIADAEIKDGKLILKSVQFNSEILMHPRIESFGTLIFSSNSFAKRLQDDTHEYVVDTDVDPYQDEVFTSGNDVEPSTTYACSCPAYTKSVLSMPQATQDDGTRKINRQRRYPLPTAQGQDRFVGAGAQSAAGKISSWETLEDRYSLKLCKHTIASMFSDNIKTLEPSQYPTVEARLAFDQKLEDEIAGYNSEVLQAFKRGGISLTEIVFALAQGLNLDNVETAYVVLNSN